MADKANVDIKDKHPAPDKSEATGAKGHCEHCAEHHARISAVEARLGMQAQPGAAREETGAHKEKKPSYERARH